MPRHVAIGTVRSVRSDPQHDDAPPSPGQRRALSRDAVFASLTSGASVLMAEGVQHSGSLSSTNAN